MDILDQLLSTLNPQLVQNLEGAKLYFEMRKDGALINPGDWFVR